MMALSPRLRVWSLLMGIFSIRFFTMQGVQNVFLSQATKQAMTLFLLSNLIACGGGDDTPGPSNTAGKHEHVLELEDMQREFIVYVPEQVATMQNVPLLFMFHGTTGTGEKFYNISYWREKADQENFIAVFPSALTYCYREDTDYDGHKELRFTTKWASGELGNTGDEGLPLCTADELAMLPPEKQALADHPLKDDVAFVDAMLDFILANYSIDPKHIYASGFSNGGGMVIRLAVERSERFAALSASAGVIRVPPLPAARAHSFVFAVGAEDEAGLLSFNQGLPANEQALSLPLDESLFTVVPAFKHMVVDPLLEVLQLKDISIFESALINGVQTGQFRFANSMVGEGNSLTVIIMAGLEHQYPNGHNHPIVMADYLWDFFKDKRLP
ncbi:MAG TPA: hypothetical protein ENI98_07040 [Gammaproteobacteria bacterium]|nr:hypothetical protein [Gammaproteobacteria bacterium]